MTQQHLHTPLVWFSSRMECVPWCVQQRSRIEFGGVEKLEKIVTNGLSKRIENIERHVESLPCKDGECDG